MTRGAATAARRLAHALLEGVDPHAEAPAAIRAALARVRKFLVDDPGARTFLAHPRVDRDAKERLLAVVVSDARDEGRVARLVRLLSSRGRLDLVPSIEENYIAQWNERRGVLAGEIVSPAPLDGAQVERVRAALSRVAGLTVELAARVDPSVVGGVLVRLQGRTLDGTARGRLQMLRARLHQAALVQ
jgi:F-type H+-transporting ATPase subunit delta